MKCGRTPHVAMCYESGSCYIIKAWSYHAKSCLQKKKKKKRWEEGRVVRRLSQPRSYDVDTPSGHVLRRNRRHIRQTGEAYKQPQPHINTDDHHTPPRQNTNTSNQNNNSQYTTRYGRHVRKPDRLDL